MKQKLESLSNAVNEFKLGLVILFLVVMNISYIILFYIHNLDFNESVYLHNIYCALILYFYGKFIFLLYSLFKIRKSLNNIIFCDDDTKIMKDLVDLMSTIKLNIPYLTKYIKDVK